MHIYHIFISEFIDIGTRDADNQWQTQRLHHFLDHANPGYCCRCESVTSSTTRPTPSGTCDATLSRYKDGGVTWLCVEPIG